MAFQMGRCPCHEEAAKSGSDLLLEPVDEVNVLVWRRLRRGRMSDPFRPSWALTGTEPVGVGPHPWHAEVPEVEITRYAIDLRSLSHGQARSPDKTCATNRCRRSSATKVIAAHSDDSRDRHGTAGTLRPITHRETPTRSSPLAMVWLAGCAHDAAPSGTTRHHRARWACRAAASSV